MRKGYSVSRVFHGLKNTNWISEICRNGGIRVIFHLLPFSDFCENTTVVYIKKLIFLLRWLKMLLIFLPILSYKILTIHHRWKVFLSIKIEDVIPVFNRRNHNNKTNYWQIIILSAAWEPHGQLWGII